MAAKKVLVPDNTTLANLIWDKVKEAEIEYACLPGQTIEKHAQRVEILIDKVHLKPKAGMVVPLIEAAVNNKPYDRDNKYVVTQEDQFVVISLAPKG